MIGQTHTGQASFKAVHINNSTRGINRIEYQEHIIMYIGMYAVCIHVA